MSSDWIKMRVDLRTHPKVVRMASALKADKLRVIGGLFATWAIFDAHSTDGFLDGYSFQVLDDELGWKGFSKAMAGIQWLSDEAGNGLTAPEFDEHNGRSAKSRALDTQRKRLGRMPDDSPHGNGSPSGMQPDKTRTREEKRREEKREKEKRTQPVGVDQPTERALSSVEDFEPTTAGVVCRAMKQAGMAAVNPGDPRLLALLAQGATEAEFAGLATEAVAKDKGFAWVLAVLQARRAEAADIRLAPTAEASAAIDPMDWTKTRSGVMARAGNLGMDAWNGDPREWPKYLRQVIDADAEQHRREAA